MPRIRCNYEGCIHLEGAFCTAGEIELDQELGCLTFSQVDEEIIDVEEDLEEATVAVSADKEWEEEDFEEDEDEDLEEWDEDEDEDWEDDEDEEDDGWSSSRQRRR